MLAIRDLQVRYGAITAVRGVDLDIKAGEIVALLGANGAGKSTIARAIAGLLPFDCHASACAPSDVSKARTCMLATTRAGSCSSRSSAQPAPLQPRVISTWATKP